MQVFLVLFAPVLVMGEIRKTGSVTHFESCDAECYREPITRGQDVCKYVGYECEHWCLGKVCKCDCGRPHNWIDEKVSTAEKVPGSNPARYQEVKKSYYRKVGNSYRCGVHQKSYDLPYQPALCNLGAGGCCNAQGYCGGSDGDCHCEDCFNWVPATKDCTFDGLATPVDKCTLGTPIDVVEQQVFEQQMWNLAHTTLEAVPGVGDVFNVIFGVMEPVGPITNAATIGQDIQNAVNLELDKLRSCMDQRVNKVISAVFKEDFGVLFFKAAEAGTLNWSDAKRDRIRTLWIEYNGKMATLENYKMFLISENNQDVAVAYMDLLPVYQIFTVNFYAVFAGALEEAAWNVNHPGPHDDVEDLKCNYNAILNTGRSDLKILYDWILAAEEHIAASYTPNTSYKNGCDYQDSRVTGEWDRVFTCGNMRATQKKQVDESCGRINCNRSDRCGDGGRIDLRTVNVEVTMTPNHVCRFHLRGHHLCDGNKVLDGMEKHTNNLVNAINDRVSKEWRPAFRKKYVHNLVEFIETFWDIEDKPSRKQCNFQRVEKPDLSNNAQSTGLIEQVLKTKLGTDVVNFVVTEGIKEVMEKGVDAVVDAVEDAFNDHMNGIEDILNGPLNWNFGRDEAVEPESPGIPVTYVAAGIMLALTLSALIGKAIFTKVAHGGYQEVTEETPLAA